MCSILSPRWPVGKEAEMLEWLMRSSPSPSLERPAHTGHPCWPSTLTVSSTARQNQATPTTTTREHKHTSLHPSLWYRARFKFLWIAEWAWTAQHCNRNPDVVWPSTFPHSVATGWPHPGVQWPLQFSFGETSLCIPLRSSAPLPCWLLFQRCICCYFSIVYVAISVLNMLLFVS